MELLIPVPLPSPVSQQQLCDLIYSGHFMFMDSHNGGLFVWLLSLRRIFLAGLLKKAKRQRQPEAHQQISQLGSIHTTGVPLSREKDGRPHTC